MAISEKDIKKLWGRSAGRCAFPGCNCDCLPFLKQSEPTVIGEMAHVISKSPIGPRGDGIGDDNTYENLILLCPTHHRTVDKAPPGTFCEKMLNDWKRSHENAVSQALSAPLFEKKHDLFEYISPLLIENHACWKTYGPESEVACANPVSNLSSIWVFRKLSTIVPNNGKIVESLKINRKLLSRSEYRIASEFIEHAAGFERNCYERLDGTPRFPVKFEALVNGD